MENTDKKRWLADLRGKDMPWPETFTWSYKRRYKKGYVWRDLLDDDLISTPVSDNEYVLKASQMLSHHSSSSFGSPHSHIYAAEKKNCCLLKEIMQPPKSEEAAIQMHHISPHHNSGSSSIHVDDAVLNIQGDSSTAKTDATNHQQSSTENSGFCSNLLLKKKKKKKKIKSSDGYNYKASKEMGCSTTTSCSSSSSAQSQSVPAGETTKRRHLRMFRNLINCGAVDTNDAVHVRLNRDSNNKDIIIRKENRENSNAGTVGSAGLFRTFMDQQKNQNNASKRADDRNQKTVSSAYMPIRWPHCSHCRKQFKPDKLHSHMKSCKGMKALSKSAPAAVSKMP